jgi:hypothetical protein
VRNRIVVVAMVAGLVFGGSVPSGTAQVPNPVDQTFASENVTVLNRLTEGAGAISMQFASDAPIMYLSTVKGLQIYDISDPAAPALLGAEPLPHFQNEAMSIGERRNGTKFAIIASTLVAASTAGDVDPGNARFIIVVDVTDPTAPEVVSSLETETRTHTVSCVDLPECRFAYSDGRSQGAISIIDLRDPSEPKMAGTFKSVVPRGHDSDLDDAGILWHVGGEGAVALDVSKPTKPVQLNSTGPEGVENTDRANSPYNNFILHNSFRPNAKRFKSSSAPALRNGNVLLATEEDTTAGQCGPQYGSFQTWHIPHLSAKKFAKANPLLGPGGGSIEPLDNWYPEDAAAGAHCSAHYFDYHDEGLVAQGWYEYGMRILDVRNPRKIQQLGYFFTPAAETWAAYWVPEYGSEGRQTGRDTNLIYTADVSRGVDILEFALPKGKRSETRSVTAPALPAGLLSMRPQVSLPTSTYGYACRIPLEN